MADAASATRRCWAAALSLVTLMALVACGEDDGDVGGQGPEGTTGRTETFDVRNRNHVQGPIEYPQTPPVGGDHNAVWQNCGFYSQPIEPERAVHSMEHGAVWITYRSDLPAAQVDVLRQLARNKAYVLVSPWKDGSLPAPVVASAWGVQRKLPSATDPALAQFVDTFAGKGGAPEPGASCSGAVGVPE